MQILNKIQQELKVPKQQNKSVAYKSRSAEDILEMVKPLLGEAILTANFEPVLIGNRYYIKATSTLTHGKESFSATAYAREDETPKFMSLAQGSGSTSSYALKYSLNVLFAIDDTQDDDTREHVPTANTAPNKATPPPKKELPFDMQINKAIGNAKNVAELEVIATGIKTTEKLTEAEKKSLIALVDMRAMDFEDVEITPDTVPFNN